MADLTKLQAAVDAAVAQVAKTKGVQASAVTLINSFKDILLVKIKEAVDADNALDQAGADVVTQLIEEATAEMTDSTNALGDAVVANS